MAETAEEAVRQCETRGNEFSLGTQNGPSITMRGKASVALGPSITMRGTASAPPRYRSGPPLQCAVEALVPLGPSITVRGTARALYYNARYRFGAASVPLEPSIAMRGTDTPFAFHKVLM